MIVAPPSAATAPITPSAVAVVNVTGVPSTATTRSPVAARAAVASSVRRVAAIHNRPAAIEPPGGRSPRGGNSPSSTWRAASPAVHGKPVSSVVTHTRSARTERLVKRRPLHPVPQTRTSPAMGPYNAMRAVANSSGGSRWPASTATGGSSAGSGSGSSSITGATRSSATSTTAGSSSACPHTSHATTSSVADQRVAPQAGQGVAASGTGSLPARDRGAHDGAARVEEPDGGQLRVLIGWSSSTRQRPAPTGASSSAPARSTATARTAPRRRRARVGGAAR